MKNWFTVHDPHPTPNWLKWHIYLQDKYKELAAEISVGDRVFFYEAKTTKQLQFKGCIGKMGLVHIGHVTGPAYPRKIEDALSVYNDGDRKLWGIGIPTDAENSNGFVPQAKVVDVLRYASNYYFKGFAGGKGIKHIEADEADELQTLFVQSLHSLGKFTRTSSSATTESHRYPDRTGSAQASAIDQHNRRIDGIQSLMTEIDEEASGYVYVLETKEIDLPVCKIGRTTRSPHKRCEEINKSSTGDFIWKVAHYIVVDNCKKLEKLVHLKLLPLRQKGREFFNINADDAYTALTSIFDSQTEIKKIEEPSPKLITTKHKHDIPRTDSEYEELFQSFESVLNVKCKPFGQRSQPGFGVSDGNEGVQWNLVVNADTGFIRLGVNLEGMKYNNWPISDFIQSELSNPNIDEVAAILNCSDEIFIRFTRDAWQVTSRPPIVGKYLGGREFTFEEINLDQWSNMLKEALGCLHEETNYRGRAEQTVTLENKPKTGEQVRVMEVSPHLNIWSPLSWKGNASENIELKIRELQPVYDWVRQVSQA